VWWFGGYGKDELQSRPTLPFAVPALIAGAGGESSDAVSWDSTPVISDSVGKLQRLTGLPQVLSIPPQQVVGSGNENLFTINNVTWQVAGHLMQLELDIMGYDEADTTSTGSEKIVQLWRYTGSLYEAVSTLERIEYEAGLPQVTFVWATDFFSTKMIQCQAAGISGKTWNMNTVLKVTVLRQGT
jgi:hypothetical protein